MAFQNEIVRSNTLMAFSRDMNGMYLERGDKNKHMIFVTDFTMNSGERGEFKSAISIYNKSESKEDIDEYIGKDNKSSIEKILKSDKLKVLINALSHNLIGIVTRYKAMEQEVKGVDVAKQYAAIRHNLVEIYRAALANQFIDTYWMTTWEAEHHFRQGLKLWHTNMILKKINKSNKSDDISKISSIINTILSKDDFIVRDTDYMSNELEEESEEELEDE